MHATLPLLQGSDFPPVYRGSVDTLQLNLGYRCNQACLHCHVNAGPTRKEEMQADTVNDVVEFLQRSSVKTLDLTGGAPELNANFRRLVSTARQLGMRVIDRCNLTILMETGQENLAGFLADNRVEIVASLPCYGKDNVDGQRGNGVYATSIKALQLLNRLGYGHPGSRLELNLMYNPAGATLPPEQKQLEDDYHRELQSRAGIVFNNLYVLANMPIQRFGSTLISKGNFDDYLILLKSAYQAENLGNVMCRSLISVDWNGFLYDCDFNQMLDLPLEVEGRGRLHLRDLQAEYLEGNPVVVCDHCYGCTAGQGSSCSGALE
jgi:radical SAM/Cys-rich protein